MSALKKWLLLMLFFLQLIAGQEISNCKEFFQKSNAQAHSEVMAREISLDVLLSLTSITFHFTDVDQRILVVCADKNLFVSALGQLLIKYNLETHQQSQVDAVAQPLNAWSLTDSVYAFETLGVDKGVAVVDFAAESILLDLQAGGFSGADILLVVSNQILVRSNFWPGNTENSITLRLFRLKDDQLKDIAECTFEPQEPYISIQYALGEQGLIAITKNEQSQYNVEILNPCREVADLLKQPVHQAK